jgi:hypothetical protein
MRVEASQEKQQGHTEATNTAQGHSGGAAPEGDRCDRTRTIVRGGAGYLTNDLPGCPNKGGLLSSSGYGLRGEKGDDEVRGLGGSDELYGGVGNDHIYGGPGGEWSIEGDEGDDVIYGGEGDDSLSGGGGKDLLYGGDDNDKLQPEVRKDGQPDKLYCGKGKDEYNADEFDYVDSSCEMKIPTKPAKEGAGGRVWGADVVFDERTSSAPSSASASLFVVPPRSGGPAILLPAAVLLLGSGILTYAILRRR